MKTIGLIGGMSWESTVPYYQYINQAIKAQLGGLHSARLVLYSVDFYEIEQLQHKGDWDGAGKILANAALSLQQAGADFLILCTNTMHKVADVIEATVDIPLLHITEATAAAIHHAGFNKVGLLGTRFTMEQAFYRGSLKEKQNIDVLIPEEHDRQLIHSIIYQEICQGIIRDESRRVYRGIIAKLVEQGAQGIILGCTEISMLVKENDSSVPLFDTTFIHANSAALYALDSFEIIKN